MLSVPLALVAWAAGLLGCAWLGLGIWQAGKPGDAAWLCFLAALGYTLVGGLLVGVAHG